MAIRLVYSIHKYILHKLKKTKEATVWLHGTKLISISKQIHVSVTDNLKCRNVTPRKRLVNGEHSYSSMYNKCIFIAHKKPHVLWSYRFAAKLSCN